MIILGETEQQRQTMDSRSLNKDLLPFIAMVSVECTNVGLNILFKAATLKGMSYFVFIAYSNAIATLILFPVPFIFRSSPVPPSLKLPLLYRICILALIGFLAHIAGSKGIEYSSPTLASAMSNLTPAFTFTFAVLFRMEKLALRSQSTQAKIIGTIASIAGALVVVFYKGPTILSSASPNSDWLIGGLLLAFQYLLFSLWFILLVEILKICPTELLVTFIYTLCVTIISAPVCFLAERNLNAWRLRLDITLIAIVYSAIFGPCYSTIVHSWGLRLKGPVYIAMFKPLSIAIAAIMGVIFLEDVLHLGIIIGALVISIGFYVVIWGKAKEEILNEDHGFSDLGSTQKVPFLQASIEDM